MSINSNKYYLPNNNMHMELGNVILIILVKEMLYNMIIPLHTSDITPLAGMGIDYIHYTIQC